MGEVGSRCKRETDGGPNRNARLRKQADNSVLADKQHALQSKTFPRYISFMTKLLDQALEAVRKLPPRTQDEVAEAMIALAAADG